MREDNMLRVHKKRFTTNSAYRLLVYPSLVADMDLAVSDQLWMSDLVYTRLGHEFIYLAVVRDVRLRCCLSWPLRCRLDAALELDVALATAALRIASTD